MAGQEDGVQVGWSSGVPLTGPPKAATNREEASMKPKVCLILALAVLLASGAGLSEAPGLHPAGGLLFEDPNTVPGMTVLTEIPGAPNLPAAVDLSAEMPPVRSQGGQNSCVAWAIGYYDKTHAEWVEHGWDITRDTYQISPSFIYNHINGGVNGGVSMSSAQGFICGHGACMMSDMPYNQSDYLSWPSESAYARHSLSGSR
jgi:hypothetical protein